jgi:membrane fusion protein, multidrug efflux system
MSSSLHSTPASKRQWLAERPYVLAIIITLVLVLWMVSGAMQAQDTPPTHQKQKAAIAKVQVKNMHAQTIHDSIELYGRTEPNRISTLRAEIQGKVVQVLAKRGASIRKDQIIAKIDLNDLQSQFKSSQALIKQREIEYQGAKALSKKGYQGQAKLAQAFAALELAKAEMVRLQLDIDHGVIRAPFDGVLNDRYVEVGDYVKSGDKIALVADLDPLVVRAYATEKQISHLALAQAAELRLVNNRKLQGQIRYIASVADQATNTFKIEVSVDNPNNQMSAGLSSEMNIALEQVSAIKLSPALLALDEQGNIGVKSVVEKHVVFTPINIVKTQPDGIWLTGLGENADIIILGQGFVRAGDAVEASSNLPTKSTGQGE